MSEQKKTYGVAQQNTKNAVAYMRVASSHESDIALQMQKRVIQSLGVQEGYTIRKFYSDVGSGLNLDREGLTMMQTRIAEGGIDAILTVAFDRISRSHADMQNFWEFMQETGIDLVSVNEGSFRKCMEAQESFYGKLLEFAANGIFNHDEYEDDESLDDFEP